MLEISKLNSEDVIKRFLLKLKRIFYLAIKLRRLICNTKKNSINKSTSFKKLTMLFRFINANHLEKRIEL